VVQTVGVMLVRGARQLHDCQRILLWVLGAGAGGETQQLVLVPAVPVGSGQLTGAVRQLVWLIIGVSGNLAAAES